MDYGIRGRTAIVCAASQGLGQGLRDGAGARRRRPRHQRAHARPRWTRRRRRSARDTGVVGTGGRRRHHDRRGPRRGAGRLPGHRTSWSTMPAARRSATFATGTRPRGIAAVNDNMITPIMLIRAVVDGMIARRLRPHRQHHVALGQGAARASRAVQRRPRGTHRLRRGPRAPGREAQRRHQQPAARSVRHRPRRSTACASSRRRPGRTTTRSPRRAWPRSPRDASARPTNSASACAFLCSVDAGFIVGQNLLIDGGAVNATL